MHKICGDIIITIFESRGDYYMKDIYGYLFYKYKQYNEEYGEKLGGEINENKYLEEFSNELSDFSFIEESRQEDDILNELNELIDGNDIPYDSENIINSYLLEMKDKFNQRNGRN